MSIEENEFLEESNKDSEHGSCVELTYPDYFQSTDFTGSVINLYKQDVIALAKHFKLTPKDIGEE